MNWFSFTNWISLSFVVLVSISSWFLYFISIAQWHLNVLHCASGIDCVGQPAALVHIQVNLWSNATNFGGILWNKSTKLSRENFNRHFFSSSLAWKIFSSSLSEWGNHLWSPCRTTYQQQWLLEFFKVLDKLYFSGHYNNEHSFQ